jgi:hypothetical protein
LVVGIPVGTYIGSSLNADYAIEAAKLLQSDGSHADSATGLWRLIVSPPSKKHNQQMDVVLALWRKHLIPRLEKTKTPNKAPEPTTFAVTSRAMLRFAEMKPQTDRPIAARAAPAKVVAHL